MITVIPLDFNGAGSTVQLKNRKKDPSVAVKCGMYNCKKRAYALVIDTAFNDRFTQRKIKNIYCAEHVIKSIDEHEQNLKGKMQSATVENWRYVGENKKFKAPTEDRVAKYKKKKANEIELLQKEKVKILTAMNPIMLLENEGELK